MTSMLLSAAALSQTSARAAPIFSPSAHPFMRRVSARCFRFDPYKSTMGAPAAPTTHAASVTPAADAPAAPVLAAACVAPARAVPAAPVAALAAPTAVSSTAPRFATIRFKHARATFLAPFKISVGDLVVVDGDRGEDVGAVEAITTEAPATPPTSKVLRRVRDADRDALAVKTEREVEALAYTKTVAAAVRLNAEVTDVEYQLDLGKLTIFVERATASTFVDFRKLQRSLFKHYKCRIWCAYMDEVIA